MAEEDRISNLPDDIIHHILSFLDLKYAMQTSALSKKWKLVWTLLPQLNLDSYKFSSTPCFNKFVKHALLHRNNLREVSVLELRCRGAVTQFTGKSIVNYASLHNVRRLTLVWTGTKHHEFPQFLFSCRALADLTLEVQDRTSRHERCYISETGWDFPALEKLNLRNFDLDGEKNKRINLFSKCMNLKDLTLHEIGTYELKELNLCIPQLSNLSVTFRPRCSFQKALNPKVLNVVGHQLQNLTASVDSIDVLHRRDLLQNSAEGFDSLKKVSLSWYDSHYEWENKTHVSKLLGVFQKLYSAKFLILDVYIIEVLSSCLDQKMLEPCPFNNLKCLKINTVMVTRDGNRGPTIRKRVVVPIQLKNYFLDKSPTATFITDYPQNVHDNAVANNLAKLEAETKLPDTINDNRILEANIQMQDQVTTKHKEMFDAEIEMQDKVPQKRCRQQVHDDDDDAGAKKMAKLDLQKQQPPDTITTQDKEMLDANIQMQDEVISKQEAMFDAKIQMQEQAVTKQKAMFEAKMQMQDEVITKQKLMFEAKIQMLEAKLQMRDNVIAEQKARIQMLEEGKLDHEKFISYVIKSKIAELKVQVESGNPDFEVIRSIGSEIESVIMEFIPESLRAVMKAQFSFEYVKWKSLFLTQIDASQWAKIETELGIINGL